MKDMITTGKEDPRRGSSTGVELAEEERTCVGQHVEE